ncbi:hypothetical protein HAV22_07905 [Massilia sp. TW-1]|uniref:Uncharacterized protein n=1 Tax=Telluria antibiotica TaxID=2717319 RepID=A0ABX0PBR9_9BURK|nr:hypothetical protein [Telluria antibiotica]NIA53575.1 hypothetical protein [Telluria antibiotica]
MPIAFRIRVPILLLYATLPVHTYARVGEAEVRKGPRGGPCFTIAAREARLGAPDFQAIAVWDGTRPVWKMAMPKGHTFPLTYGMCVPYGGRVAALPRTASTALSPGRVYNVRIDARAGGARAASAYEARFCVARREDGSAVVHQIGSGGGRHTVECAAQGE